MDEKRRFQYRLRDFNLSDPVAKRDYNKKLFSPVAEVYPLVTRLLSFGRDAAWKRKLVDGLTEGGVERILDLACGPGDLTFRLAARYSRAEIVGIDLNPQMLSRALASLEVADEELQERVSFIEGDMNQLPFEDAGFDLITGGYALRNSPDLKRSLNEISRMLKPGGRAAFLDFSRSSRRDLSRIQTGLIAFWGRLWGRLLHRNPEVYGYIAESLKAFPDAAAFNKMLGEAGFDLLLSRGYMFGMLRITMVIKRT